LLLKATLERLVAADDTFARCLKNSSAPSSFGMTSSATESPSAGEDSSGAGSGDARDGGDGDGDGGNGGDDTNLDGAYDEACLLAELNFNDKLVLDLGCGTGQSVNLGLHVLVTWCACSMHVMILF
jgi:hypothetical protein